MKRIWQWIRQRLVAFRFRTNKAAGDTAAADNTAPVTQGLDVNTPFVAYKESVNQLDDVVIKLGLHKRACDSQEYMYEMGRRDGSLGVQLQHVASIAQAAAQELFRHIYVILKGRLAALKAELAVKENILRNDEQAYRREQAYYDYVQYQYRFFPRSHSLFLFWLYLLFGLALILADFPLALNLTREGFNLTGGTKPGETFPYLFKGSFWRVIQANWETVVTAMGVALCSIYIKIYYDEFVGTPFANRVMTFRRFLEENGMEDIEPARRHVYKEQRQKFWWKTGLFIITIGVILALAFFRIETVSAGATGKMTFIKSAAFVGITLLFPLIGGVCLSLAFNNLQNIRRLRHARQVAGRTRTGLQAAVDAYTVIKKNCEDLVAADERLCNEQQMIAEYRDYLLAFYWRGHAIGNMQPEKYVHGEDFFTKIKEWRNIAISANINHHVGKLN